MKPVRTPLDPDSPAVTRMEKLYFAAVGLSALWIGAWGYFLPTQQKAIPFPVPALHARFLGAMYLSAVVLLAGGYLKSRWDEISVVPLMTAIWTGGIFLVSLLHLEMFDFEKPQTWIWLIAYGIYPIVAIRMTWRHQAEYRPAQPTALIPSWVRRFLLGFGVLLIVLADLLFLLPRPMVEVWPWPITVPLAQLYAAPFMSFGFGSLVLSRMPSWGQMQVGSLTITVFAAGVLIASILHRDLFSFVETADLLWFGSFVLVTVLFAYITRKAFKK